MSKERNVNTAGDRTLTARSVLLSMLLGNQPPRAPVGQLVRTAGLFGVAEGTARTALSRMVTSGEVSTADGWYEIAADRLLARQQRQSSSRSGETAAWDGRTWVQCVVVAVRARTAADRTQLRNALVLARLAELREGVWLRPDNLGALPALPRQSVGDVATFRCDPTDDPAHLAARLWDLTAWSERTGELIGAMQRLLAPIEEGDHRMLAAGFLTSADVLRHFQADPLLPRRLLPGNWPGQQLREVYDRYDQAYRSLLAIWFRSHR